MNKLTFPPQVTRPPGTPAPFRFSAPSGVERQIAAAKAEADAAIKQASNAKERGHE